MVDYKKKDGCSIRDIYLVVAGLLVMMIFFSFAKGDGASFVLTSEEHSTSPGIRNIGISKADVQL